MARKQIEKLLGVEIMSSPWEPVNDLSTESENLQIKRVDQIKSFDIFKLLNNH